MHDEQKEGNDLHLAQVRGNQIIVGCIVADWIEVAMAEAALRVKSTWEVR